MKALGRSGGTVRRSLATALRKLGADSAAMVRVLVVSIDPVHATTVIVFARDNRAYFQCPGTVNVEAWAHDLRAFLR